MEDEPTSRGLEEAREVFRRRKWVAILTFGGAFATVASVVMFLPNLYRSGTTVVIDRQQIPVDLVKSTVTSDLEVRLQTISQEILSRSRLEGVIDRFELYQGLRKRVPLEKVLEQMREHIKLELKGSERRGDRMTVAFTISFSGTDPQKVALVANILASFYIEENLKARERQAAGTTDFLRVQLQQMKEKLEAQEKRLSTFKENHIGELPHQMAANLTALEQLSSQLHLNSDNQIQIGERRTALTKQLEEAEGIGPHGGPKAIAGRLAELRQTLGVLQTRYSDKYPDVAALKAEIAALEVALLSAADNSESTVPATPQVLQMRQAIAEADWTAKLLRAEAERLRASIAVYQKRVENEPRRAQEYQALSRDYETTQELYKSLLTRQGEADVGESMEQRQKGEQFRVIEPAIASEEPAAPNRWQFIALGLLLAIGLSVGAVLLAEQLDTSFHTVEELRARFGARVLVSIPHLITAADAVRQRKRLGFAAASAMLSLGVIVGVSYLLAREQGPLAVLILK